MRSTGNTRSSCPAYSAAKDKMTSIAVSASMAGATALRRRRWAQVPADPIGEVVRLGLAPTVITLASISKHPPSVWWSLGPASAYVPSMSGSPSTAEDSPPDPNEVENAWATEIERRCREIREGKVELVPGDEVRRKLREWKPRDR